MPDAIPLPHVGGSLAPFEAIDLDVLTMTGAVDMTAAVVNVQNAPTDPAGTIVEIRDSGATVLATITIAQGTRSNAWSGTATPASGMLVARITAHGGATELSGRIQFDGPVALTTVDRVKSHRGITSTASDADISFLIRAVTGEMQGYMGRDILAGSETDERHRLEGTEPFVTLDHFPIRAVSSVAVSGFSIASGEYHADLAGGSLDYQPSASKLAPWPPGELLVSYTHGYTTVPPELVQAATEQVGHAFAQHASGGDRLGDTAQALETGGTVGYVPAGFLPQVVAVMDRYREVRARGI